MGSKIDNMSKNIEEILFLTIDFPPAGGGMSQHCFDVASALKKAGEPVVILAPGVGSIKYNDKTEFEVIRLKGVESGKVFNSYYKSLIIFFVYGLFYCLTHRVKAIFVNTWAMVGPLALALHKIFGIPYFVFAHGLDVYSSLKDDKVKKLMGVVFRNASTVIVISHFTKNLIEKAVKNVEIKILHPVIDLERFSLIPAEHKSALEGKKVILTVARLVESKNHQAVIRALPKVIERFPDLVYYVVGQGPTEKKLRSLADDLGLKDKVVFTGNVDQKQLSVYYNSCDIFILTSIEIPDSGEVEGFGIVFLEAGVYAKAVIGGRSGGIPDSVLDQETGLLVSPLDIEDISNVIIRLLSDDTLRKKLGDNARKRVENELNIDRLSQKLADIIKDGLDKKT